MWCRKETLFCWTLPTANRGLHLLFFWRRLHFWDDWFHTVLLHRLLSLQCVKSKANQLRLLRPHSQEVNRSAIPSDTTSVTPNMSKECSHVCMEIVFQQAGTRGSPSGKPDWSQINIPFVMFRKVSLRRALTSQGDSRPSVDGSITVGGFQASLKRLCFCSFSFWSLWNPFLIWNNASTCRWALS